VNNGSFMYNKIEFQYHGMSKYKPLSTEWQDVCPINC